MLTKTGKHQYFFEVELSGTGGNRGLLRSNKIPGSIEIATAPEFKGGVAGYWTAEHLFLGSLCSGFMTTYQALAAQKELEVLHISCNAIGQVNLYEGHLEFTTINLYPKIYIKSEEGRELASQLLLSAYSYCIIANSVKALLVNHGEVLLEEVGV